VWGCDMMAKRERLCWFLAVLGLSMGTVFGALTNLRLLRSPRVTFTGEPSRGAFVPSPSSVDMGPSTYRCLVAVTGDDSVWRYRVWRDDRPAIEGKGPVVIPQ
jgi:hypothetical protein